MKMNYTTILSLFLSIIFFTNCKQKPDNLNNAMTKDDIEAIDNVKILSSEEGLALLKTNCYSCHNPVSASHDSIIAPPMVGAKAEYKILYTDRAKFIARMSDFIAAPTKGNAVMKGPVWRFGLMPPPTLDKKTIQEIVAFIYDNDLEAPTWFPAHYENEHGEKWEQ
jgi:hypothetical protein